MHPAYSVIFFTTSSGAGYGLLALLGLMGALGIAPATQSFAIISMLIALTLITFGLLASTFHLGHPERAWRALSQWRTSWLSREGVLAIVTYPVAFLFGLGFSGLSPVYIPVALLGALTALLSAMTVISTGQIYASLKTIRAWNTSLTTPIYLTFAFASGLQLLNGLLISTNGQMSGFALLASGAIIVAILLKVMYWRTIDSTPRDLTMENATGLKPKVRQWETPHTQKNYIQREMGFVVARRHRDHLRMLILVLLAASGLASIAALIVPPIIFIGLLTIAIGLVFERWLFFAEAEHVVTLYYGNERA